MDVIASILTNPIVSGVGYLLSFFSGIIAIYQYIGKNKAEKEVASLKLEITNFQGGTINKNKIEQGEKSQYFQDNSGLVNIDNRG